ncbi:MAG: ribonuclease J, partial [Clostridia bacterium]|nr:ribonuclease J [Clostridia bacterium]
MNALSKQSHKQQPKPNYAAGSKPTKYKRPKKNQPAQSLPFHYQTGGRQTGRRQKQRRAPKARPLRISFLGGINEVGKNMTVFEYENDMIIVDSGLAFPDEDMLGIDLVIPDFTYIKENADKLRGVVITHGHEDHIGSLAYLLKEINVPVYATRLTVGLIKGKLEEHKLLSSARLNEVSPGEHVTLGGFDVEFIHVNHSIPDAVGFAIRCGAGTVIHTGDFKIDATPIDGGMIDLARFGQLGREGVLCMLADSTNAERPGFTQSERKVGESFERLFKNAGDRRIIIATFASNIHRVQQIIDVAQKEGRKVALSGRSLENV